MSSGVIINNLPAEKQVLMLRALISGLLNDKAKESKVEKLLKDTATKQHIAEKHEGLFEECKEAGCTLVVQALYNQRSKQSTFFLSELDPLLKSTRLSIGTRLAGTVSVWLEEESKVQVIL